MLSKWNPKIKPGTLVSVVAPRGSGKIFFIRDFIFNSEFHDVVVISPIEKMNRTYEFLYPGILIFHELNQETLDAIEMLMERQIIIGPDVAKERQLLIIMEGCIIFDEKYLNSQTMKNLYKNCKSHNFTLLVDAQCIRDLPSDLENILDILIVFRVLNLPIQKQIHKKFFRDLDENKFAKFFEKYTNNFGCLIKDTTDLKQQYFWYKADAIKFSEKQKMIFNQCPLIKEIAKRHKSVTKNWIDQQPIFDEKVHFKSLLSFHQQYIPSKLENQVFQLTQTLENWKFINSLSTQENYSKVLFSIIFVRDYLLIILQLPRSLCDLIFQYDVNYFYSGGNLRFPYPPSLK